eukprot:Pgem_evm1s13647
MVLVLDFSFSPNLLYLFYFDLFIEKHQNGVMMSVENRRNQAERIGNDEDTLPYLPYGLVTLGSLLLKPLQRVTKYPLFLKELYKWTSKKHDDYSRLELALNGMNELNNYLNESKRKREQLARLVEMHGRIRNWSGPSLIGGGDYIIEGMLRVSTKPKGKLKKYHLFLSSKRIYFVQKKGKKMIFVASFSLRDIKWVKDIGWDVTLSEGWCIQTANLFENNTIIGGEDRNIFFSAENQTSHKDWVKKMKNSIHAQNHRASLIIEDDFIDHRPKNERSSELDLAKYTQSDQFNSMERIEGKALPNPCIDRSIRSTRNRVLSISEFRKNSKSENSAENEKMMSGRPSLENSFQIPANRKYTPISTMFPENSNAADKSFPNLAYKDVLKPDEREEYEQDPGIDFEVLANDIGKVAKAVYSKELYCASCNNKVAPDLGIKTSIGIFHKLCFTCDKCHEVVGTKFYTFGSQVLCEKDFVSFKVCPKCSLKLTGETVIVEGVISYHRHCFTCDVCSNVLSDVGAFVSKEKSGIWCQKHYTELFIKKCVECRGNLTEAFCSALGKTWHLECFICSEN